MTKATGKERIIGILSELVSSAENFNRCVESDLHLSEILTDTLHSITEMAAADILFQNGDSMKIYHHASSEAVQYNIHGIIASSVLG